MAKRNGAATTAAQRIGLAFQVSAFVGCGVGMSF